MSPGGVLQQTRPPAARTATKPWTAAHLRFLAAVKMPFPEEEWAFQAMFRKRRAGRLHQFGP